MYNCKLTIKVFTDDAVFAAALQKVAPRERFSHEFAISADVGMTVDKGDLIIWDLPLAESPAVWRAKQPRLAYFVLRASKRTAESLGDADYAVLDELWLKELGVDSVGFMFGKLLDWVKLAKDNRLQQICLDTLIDSAPSMIWFKDLRGSHLKVNETFCRAVGKTKQMIEGRGHYYIWDIPKEEYEGGEYVCLETEEIVLKERKLCVFDEMVKSKLGMKQLKTYKAPLFDDDGELIGTLGIASDVTDLANLGAEMEIVLNSMPFALLLWDSDGLIINVNNMFEMFFDEKKDAMLGRSYKEWKKRHLYNIELPSAGDNFNNGKMIVKGNGRLLEILERPIFDVFKNQVGFLSIYHDVTSEEAMRQQIIHYANTDILTELPNRRCFYEYVRHCDRYGVISLMYIDLDNFKQVNDTYGHQMGDRVIARTALILKQVLPDDFVARIGGDEFLAVITADHGREHLSDKARRILELLRSHFSDQAEFNFLSASIGIASMEDGSLPIDTLLAHSDSALYRAKRMGKNSFCFYDDAE